MLGAPFQVNNWVGVTMLQNLFIHEHNAIAAAVAEGEPNLDDEAIFQKTRLTMAALVAKIHTIDWTPTLLNNPTMRSAMHINWGGVMGLGPRLLGLVGARKANDNGIPYNLTEEFAACYRMNPLLPDSIPVEGGSPIALGELIGPKGELLATLGLPAHTACIYWSVHSSMCFRLLHFQGIVLCFPRCWATALEETCAGGFRAHIGR